MSGTSNNGVRITNREIFDSVKELRADVDLRFDEMQADFKLIETRLGKLEVKYYGVLAAIAAVLTAIGGAFIAITQVGGA